MSKSNSNRERREMVEQMRSQAKAAERRRTLVVVSICVVVALLIVGAAGYSIYKGKQDVAAAVSSSATTAGCEPVVEEEATGAGQHTTGKVLYETAPPAYGPHNPSADESGLHFYSADDRPDVEVLVHNLEHGWTIVWYDDTIANDAVQLRALTDTAATYASHGNDPQDNVIFAPWTAEDGSGQPIPDGKHIAFTHWSVHQPTYDPQFFATAQQSGQEIPSYGESQYCSTFSGAALDDFTKQFPYDDAPEGFLWHQ